MMHRTRNGRARTLSIFAAAIMCSLAGGALAQTLPWPDQKPQQPQPPAWPTDGRAASAAPTAVPGAAPPAPMMGGPPQMGGPARMGPAPMGMAPPGGGAQNECAAEFTRLRGEVEKRGKVAKAVSDRKGSREELCSAITNVFHAEATWVTYSRKNASKCGIPPDFIKQLNAGHKNLATMRKNICSGGGGAPPPPTLSEALGTAQTAPPPTTSTKRGGTMDSLVGNPIR